jgi:hypothetical protein
MGTVMYGSLAVSGRAVYGTAPIPNVQVIATIDGDQSTPKQDAQPSLGLAWHGTMIPKPAVM